MLKGFKPGNRVSIFRLSFSQFGWPEDMAKHWEIDFFFQTGPFLVMKSVNEMCMIIKYPEGIWSISDDQGSGSILVIIQRRQV